MQERCAYRDTAKNRKGAGKRLAYRDQQRLLNAVTAPARRQTWRLAVSFPEEEKPWTEERLPPVKGRIHTIWTGSLFGDASPTTSTMLLRLTHFWTNMSGGWSALVQCGPPGVDRVLSVALESPAPTPASSGNIRPSERVAHRHCTSGKDSVNFKVFRGVGRLPPEPAVGEAEAPRRGSSPSGRPSLTRARRSGKLGECFCDAEGDFGMGGEAACDPSPVAGGRPAPRPPPRPDGLL